MGVTCGTDIVEVGRIRKALENKGFVQRVFTEAESDYCESRGAGKYESYAARFAAKEAVLKALGIGLFDGGVKLTDIEVVNGAGRQGNKGLSSAPSVVLHREAEKLLRQKAGTSISVSLSHTKEYAIAVVVFEVSDILNSESRK